MTFMPASDDICFSPVSPAFPGIRRLGYCMSGFSDGMARIVPESSVVWIVPDDIPLCVTTSKIENNSRIYENRLQFLSRSDMPVFGAHDWVFEDAGGCMHLMPRAVHESSFSTSLPGDDPASAQVTVTSRHEILDIVLQ